MMRSTIEIRKTSIVDLDADVIVNAANEDLAAGGGVCGAIFRAAGHREMQKACGAIGHCDTGGAVITPGFGLKARYVIHAVGPIWVDGRRGEPEKLKSAYKKALELARANGCRSIGFPLISAGIYGCPMEEAWSDAVSACEESIKANKDYAVRIIFAVLDENALKAGKKAVRAAGAEAFSVARREDWKTKPMPEKTESFVLDRSFGEDEMDALRRGNIPRSMEDKWFWYMEGRTLFAHRSWTGCCIYRIDFGEDGRHTVTVNRDPEQYGCAGIEEDKASLNELLDWWTREPYDHYGEWLSETYDSLKKAGK